MRFSCFSKCFKFTSVEASHFFLNMSPFLILATDPARRGRRSGRQAVTAERASVPARGFSAKPNLGRLSSYESLACRLRRAKRVLR